MASSIFVLNGGVLTVGTQSLFPDGTSAAPSIGFLNDVGTGFRRSGLGVIVYESGGIDALALGGNTTGLTLHALSPLTWGSTALSSADTSITRAGAGKITVTGTTPMLQLGGTTSSFPAIKRNAAVLEARLADDSAYANFTALNNNFTNGIFVGGTTLVMSATAPTISSGFGTSPSIANSNGSGVFVVNVGGGAAATNGVITLPAAATGWVVLCVDLTSALNHTGLNTVQTASTTTSATIESQNSAGAATAWAANSLVRCIALAY
jgi:hypothetical protein